MDRLERLRTRVKRIKSWGDEKPIRQQDYIEEIEYLLSEIDRLKRGDFTEEEFQNLCHNFTTEDRERFEQGCRDYQCKLFGPKVKELDQF